MKRSVVLLAAAITLTLLVSVGASQFGSDQPDGLVFVAEQEGFADSAEAHSRDDTALADYGAGLGRSEPMNVAVAGLVGVLATFAIGFGVFWLARRRSDGQESVAG